jgi:FtsZ-binding cell division protein ZapB
MTEETVTLTAKRFHGLCQEIDRLREENHALRPRQQAAMAEKTVVLAEEQFHTLCQELTELREENRVLRDTVTRQQAAIDNAIERIKALLAQDRGDASGEV